MRMAYILTLYSMPAAGILPQNVTKRRSNSKLDRGCPVAQTEITPPLHN